MPTRFFAIAIAAAAIAAAPAGVPSASAQETQAPVVAVNLSNLTMADFTIAEAGLEGGHWLGDAPQYGQALPMYEADLIRAQSDGSAGAAGQSGFIVLSGYGRPITLRWSLDRHGKLGMTFAGNEKVNVHAVQVANLPLLNFTLVDRE